MREPGRPFGQAFLDKVFNFSLRIPTVPEDELRELAAVVEPGPAIVRHPVAAYCVQRTVLLLAGHELGGDKGAIQRLGLWTILTLRWPLLAERLQLHPEELEGLRDGLAPTDAGDEIAAVYALPEARRFGVLARRQGLDATAVRHFTTPIDVLAVAASDGQPSPPVPPARGRSSAGAPAAPPRPARRAVRARRRRPWPPRSRRRTPRVTRGSLRRRRSRPARVRVARCQRGGSGRGGRA